MRLWNEVATIFLISIVFIIVLKDALSMVWGVAGLVGVTALILAGMAIYKSYRKNKE
jgi:putative membrane protein